MVADVAHILHTPVTDLLEMEVHDLVDWHREAARIAKARGLI
jgi:hypothetical protein